MKDSTPYLETPRLILRQWRAEDREAFAAMCADPDVMRYFPSCLDRQASDALADRCEALIREKGYGAWALEIKGGPPFVGFTGLHVPDDELPFSPCVEILWRLARPAWGQGYATEAARAALQFGFDALALDDIVSFATVTNHRSRAVMERLGMREEPLTFAHPQIPADSPLSEHCLYRLHRRDWRQA